MRQLLLSLTILLLSACAAPAIPVATPTPMMTPRELSAAIAQATQASQSFHVQIDLNGRPVALDAAGTTLLGGMSGDLVRPDELQAVVQVAQGALRASVSTISLAGRQYLSEPLTGAWSCLEPGAVFDPILIFAPDQGLDALLGSGLQEVELVGEEPIDGQPQLHLRGSVDAAQAQTALPGLLAEGPVELDLWADTATLRLTRLRMLSNPTDPTTWTFSFSAYDQPVSIEAPIACP